MTNYIPKQQVKKVKGYKAATKIMMDKDSSILILDEEDPIIYFCQTDSFGNMSVDAFDITPHQTEEQKQTNQILTALELMNRRLEKLEARLNESDTCEDGAESIAYTEPKANQRNVEYAQVNEQSKRGINTNAEKQFKNSRG